MKNILDVDNTLCTGCGACYNKCPLNAIKIEPDENGFFVPRLNENDCVNCGLCYKICPAVNPTRLNSKTDTYAVCADDAIRKKSSSGGMFSLLANAILEDGGTVFGARYSDDYLWVFHEAATNCEELAALRGSKYVQSDTRRTYSEAKKALDLGKKVLYTGCPCQVAGLYNYLGKKYPNLYTADLICHGSNSVKAFQSFVREYSEGKEIEKLDFRDKVHYDWSTPTVMYFKDGTVKKSPWNDGRWYEGFLGGIINRECCFSCRYASDKRVADITLGDAWQVWRIDKSLDDRIGTSLVLVNNDHGKELFNRCRKDMKICKQIPLSEIRKYNGQLNHPSKPHPARKFFFSHLEKLGYHNALWYGKGMRFDTGIVGWWFASNYGSALTYYALGTILEKMDKQPIFIRIPKLDGDGWEDDTKQTIDFISKRFKVSNPRDIGHLNEVNVFCDSFMLGSDQMWTPLATDIVGYTFFLDFANLDKKKIAFSTSFGQDNFEADERVCNTAGDFLKRFDAISVREYSGVEVCKNKFGVDAEQIIDPVFLCSESDYDKLTEGIKLKLPKKYLLSYILDPTPEKEAAVQSIANKEGLKVLSIFSMRDYDQNASCWSVGEKLPKPTIEEFLYYVKNCSYLVTDSHHGACMGIIYKRPYAAITNADRGVTRFETVAKAFGLESRVLYNPSDAIDNELIHKPIDYESVSAAIKRESVRAIEWLKAAFEKETVPAKETVNTLGARVYALERCLKNTVHHYENVIKGLNEKK